MRKIFLTVILILSMLTATAFAAEDENKTETTTENQTEAIIPNEPYEYTSQTYGFKITCPVKPVVVVKPFEDPNRNGELLVFANDGIKILYGYIIELEAFDDKQVPDFNKDKKKVTDAYLEKLREDFIYNSVEIREVTPNNKGLVLVTADKVEFKDENGEVQETMTAEEQRVISRFRSKSGRCIEIQLIDAKLDQKDYEIYRKSVATYQDATDLSMPDKKKDKKSKKKK